MTLILAINPGSTSTKIAVYDGRTAVYAETIEHSAHPGGALAPETCYAR